MKKLLIVLAMMLPAAPCGPYPIDGYPYTGIRRLDFYDLAQQGVVSGRQLPTGAKYPLERIEPRFPVLEDFSALESDEEYSKQILGYLGEQQDRYGVALLDLSDPESPYYAGHNALYKSNVGSVGKLVVAVAIFQTLAELYPDDIAAREDVMRNTRVIADRFIEYDHHQVPIWDVENRKLEFRALRIGDEGTLWEYLDWMLSASSNAAASMVLRELLLLRHFGRGYPVPAEQAQEFLDGAGATALRELMLEGLVGGLEKNGIDTEQLRQGSFFTRYGKNRTGGVTSYGTPRELLKLILLLEQGKVVDDFSSREIKRLLYMTQKRIRYASHPALNDSAVYFKSGSLYSCQPEPEFKCGKYMGNKRNSLASAAIIETEKDGRNLHYLVVVISNVLRVNSAVAHQTLALRIHRMIEARHAAEEKKELEQALVQ